MAATPLNVPRSQATLQDPGQPLGLLDLPLYAPPSGINRRFLPRMAAQFSVHIDGEISTLLGVDLSFSGMLVTGESVLWPGNERKMEIKFADPEVCVHLRGRIEELVPHRGSIAMRIRFINPTDVTGTAIAQWMSRF